jgi:hypothetical protein
MSLRINSQAGEQLKDRKIRQWCVSPDSVPLLDPLTIPSSKHSES